MLFFALSVVLHHIVDSFFYLVADLIEGAWCGFAADVCTCADDGFLEAEAEFLAKLLFCDANARAAVLGYEVLKRSESPSNS